MTHLSLLNLPYDSVNVDFAFMSRQQLAVGDPDVAEWCARQFAENREYQVKPQANLVEILYSIGKKDEARQEFEKLRELAGMADLDSPPLARLQPIAHEFGLPTDWRLPEKLNKPIAGRRPLKSLGPLVWRPWQAPDWKLKDAQGREHSLAEYRGKAVMMVFFLGWKCEHCTQQLKAFAKKAEELKKGGVTLIAISVDPPAKVKEALNEYKPGPFPFLMLSDDSLSAFQPYRAYDNFEQVALHGTFLIDGDGYVRWHDISYEPFMDVSFPAAASQRDCLPARSLKLNRAPASSPTRKTACRCRLGKAESASRQSEAHLARAKRARTAHSAGRGRLRRFRENQDRLFARQRLIDLIGLDGYSHPAVTPFAGREHNFASGGRALPSSTSPPGRT